MPQDFNDFCKEYFKEAMEKADIAINKMKAKGMVIDQRLDINEVKSLAVFSALENAHLKFDKDRNVKMSTFLNKLVHNDVVSELSKESTKVRQFNLNPTKRKERMTAEEKEAEAKAKASGKKPMEDISSINPHLGSSGDDMKFYDPAEMMDIYGSDKGKDMVIRNMMRKFKQLPPIDQVVLRHWMDEELVDRGYEMDGDKPKRTYVKRVIDELGLDESAANAITVRRNKAIKKLTAMMKGQKTDFEDLYVPGSSYQWHSFSGNSTTSVKLFSDKEYEEIGNAWFKKVFE